MGADIPQPFDSRILGPVGPVTVSGIPDTFTVNVDRLPKIRLGIDPVTVNPLTLKLEPVETSLRITEIPEIRAHLPADFTVGMNVLGMELFSLRLCGEAQMITEPYRRNPCEHCEQPQATGSDVKPG